MPPVRRTSKPTAQVKSSSKQNHEAATADTVNLPPMTEQRPEGPGNLKARAEYFQKRRGNSKA